MSALPMDALPDWLEPLPDAAQQRALDAWAIGSQHTPGLTLMERAGAGLADACATLAPTGQIVICCGRGNNGGDGFAAARLLLERGRAVRVLLCGPREGYRGDALTNLERLPPSVTAPFAPGALTGAALAIDALLGTGSTGAPREQIAAAIAAINAWRRSGDAPRVVACDVPSGVDASTGELAGDAVRADLTVTFNAAKPGLWIAPGKRCVGALRVVSIGIPSSGWPLEPTVGLIRGAVRAQIPRRDAASNKFAAGSVLICGGSRGLTGAPVLAALGAARAGAGYVTAAVPASLAQIVAGKLLEVMTVELPDDGDGALRRGSARIAAQRAAKTGALVLGPGLGRQPPAAAFARAVAAHAAVPLVLDADALNAHAVEDGLERLAQRTAATVLTPHSGELARLLGGRSATIDARRLHHVRAAARRAHAVVVLKGDDTLIAAADGRVAISPGDAPALATAGSGDVLSGVLGAFLAKGVEPFTAAAAAVHVHLAAGRAAAGTLGPEGVIASDVIAALPRALACARGRPAGDADGA